MGDSVYMYPTGPALRIEVADPPHAFACRSTRRPPWALGWCTNRLLCFAVAIEFAAALVMLLWKPIADTLGHANPGIVGWGLAAAAAGLLLLADAVWKTVRSARHPITPPAGPPEQ